MSSFSADVSHHDREVMELRADRELAVEYLKLAMQALPRADERIGGLLALSTLTQAYGDLAILAVDAGVSDCPLFSILPVSGVPQFATPAEYDAWFAQRAQTLTGDSSVNAQLA